MSNLAKLEQTATPAPIGAKWQGAVGAYLAEVKKRTGSDRTPEEYGRILRRFFADVTPETATTARVHAFAYGPGPSGKQPSPSTVFVRLAAVSGFFDFARRMGLVSTNPATDVKRPKKADPSVKGLDKAELGRLLEAVPGTPSGLRDRAIILTYVLTGLRRTEALGLRKKDLTRNGAVYYTARVKGGKTRRRELPAPALKAIVKALEAQGETLEGLDSDKRLFNVSHQGFYANLRRYARKAGLEGVSGVHVLRHTAAKLRRDTGASLEEVSSLLGHRDLSVTARYLKRLEGENDPGWHAVAEALGLEE